MLSQLPAAPNTSLSMPVPGVIGLGSPASIEGIEENCTMAHSSRQQRNSVRIIAGEHRSRKLEFPSIEGLRPTADRVRETLFNWLQDSIAGEVCLDLFAGSGALGFEALSRSAGRVDFIEKDRAAAAAIRENISRLNATQGHVFCTDALNWLTGKELSRQYYGLVFLDPPFTELLLDHAIAGLVEADIMKDGCLVYVEQGAEPDAIDLPDNWTQLKSKKAGSVCYALYRVARV